MKIVLTLPPSVNSCYMNIRNSYKRILNNEARAWLEATIWEVKSKWKGEPIDDFFFIDMTFYLKDKRADSHNYKKLLIDAIERGGVCTNDKFVMDRTQAVFYDKENPRVELWIKK